MNPLKAEPKRKQEQNKKTNKKSIDHLIKQIEENDTQENRQQQQATTKLKEDLEQANELAEDLQIEIDNLKQKIQDLETANRELTNINQDTKQKLKEANKKAKNMEKTVQQTTTEKQVLEQVAQMKSTEIAELKGDITRLQNQLSAMTRDHQPAHSQPQTTTILLGHSNCRNIHPHLMRWLNQSITKEWAPTLNEVKSWIAANKDKLEGKRVILMIGTNDLKNRRTRQEVSAAHKEATDEIREAGAQLTVVQLPPVYHPQARVETRARDTEIINEILLERHGATTGKADKVTIHRGQIKSDGIHLTNESAEIMAEQIKEAIKKSNEANAEENIQITIPNNNYDPETQDNNTTKEVTTTAQVAGKIIGRGGERIRKLKTLYRVEINTDETDDDHRTFQIAGPANNATKVQKIIRHISREVTDRDQEQQEMAAYTNAPPPRQHKSTAVCRFFQKGKCNRGSSCYFLHQSGPADISMETETSSTSKEAEPSPIRKITIKPKRDTQHTSTKDRTEETKERQKRKPRSPQRKRKQPNHRSTSDDGTPERKATKKRQPSPSPSDRTTTTKRKTRTHNTPSPHTSRNHHRRDSTPRRPDHHSPRRDHSTRRDHHSPRGDHSTRRDHHSPRRSHYSPSREHQGRNPTPSPRRPDYSSTRTRTPSRDNDRRQPKSPEPYRERQGRKR